MSDKRTKLEEVATDAVQRSGLQNLSFRTLAEEVGVKSSSVHYYFPEKADLAMNLIENYTADLDRRLTNIDSQCPTTRKKLDAFVRIFADVVKAEKFCLCGMMAAEVASLNDTNRALLSQYFRKAEEWLYGVFRDSTSTIASGLKPRVLARIVISGLEGAILIDRVDNRQDRLRAQRDFIRSLTA